MSWTTTDFTEPVTSQDCRLLTPTGDDATVAKPLVIYSHGSGDSHAGISISDMAPVMQAYMDAGYRVLSCDAHGENWGNQAAMDDYASAYHYIAARFNISHTIFYGGSMGGLASLNCIARTNRIPDIIAWLGIYPVCNLANVYSLSFAGGIDSAYSISGDYSAKTAGHDPVLNAGSAFRGIGFRFYASPGDTTVPKANNSDVLSALVRPFVPECTVVVCSGPHGDLSHLQPSDNVAFIERCLARAAVLPNRALGSAYLGF